MKSNDVASNVIATPPLGIELPLADNTAEGLKTLRDTNEQLRKIPWPSPYDKTTHELRQGDARDLTHIDDATVHLIVTSPPYWTLKTYPDTPGQLGAVEDYEAFLSELDKVWCECERVLVPGGRVCCVVGDVCLSRRTLGRHLVMPLHADIQVRTRKYGLDSLTPIHWHKIANGATEAKGNGTGFYGKPFQPGAIVKNDVEYILFLRKGGEYRKVTPLQRALSMLSRDEMQSWWRPAWMDIRGASTQQGHPAPFPSEIAERLIRMFSFAGDTVLDPFAGTGNTSIAAVNAGRNSRAIDIDPGYVTISAKNIQRATEIQRDTGAVTASYQGPSVQERLKA